MPRRDAAPVGAPCWIDLTTSDTGRARDFYGRVFGWDATGPNAEFGGYINFTKDGAMIAGCMAAMPGGASDIWSVYLAVDDAYKTLGAAQTHGAQVIVPAMEVGDLGVMGVLVDPAGAATGIWQPKEHRGFGFIAEPGAPSWFQLDTRDFPGALGFYRDVFGWETTVVSDTPEFRYSLAIVDGEQVAGIMDVSGMPEVPVGWSVFLGAADTDASLATIVELGGAMRRPAEDTPYGRLAAAADPLGAGFHLVAANEAMPAPE